MDVIAFSLVTIGLLACSGSSLKADETLKTKMLRLDKETEKLIGSASCSSNSQCHSIGYGHKPCGGFYSYRIYSDQNTDVSKLKKHIKQYNDLTREQNKESDLVTDCMMLIPPQTACLQNTCQIK